VLEQAQFLSGLTRITVDAQQIGAWDSTLITFILKLQTHCSQKGTTFDPQGLPSGIRGLLKLATAVPAREGARGTSKKEPFLDRLGDAALRARGEAADVLAFIGEAFIALYRFFLEEHNIKNPICWGSSATAARKLCRSLHSSACWWA
jgi:phospholipid/cholesterol/gamma-HCH transport system permease protein